MATLFILGSICPCRYPSADRGISGPEWKESISGRAPNPCSCGGVLPVVVRWTFVGWGRNDFACPDGPLVLCGRWEMPGHLLEDAILPSRLGATTSFLSSFHFSESPLVVSCAISGVYNFA